MCGFLDVPATPGDVSGPTVPPAAPPAPWTEADGASTPQTAGESSMTRIRSPPVRPKPLISTGTSEPDFVTASRRVAPLTLKVPHETPTASSKAAVQTSPRDELFINSCTFYSNYDPHVSSCQNYVDGVSARKL